MQRQNALKINDLMRFFWRDNPDVYHRMLEARVERLWSEDSRVAQYTTNVFIKSQVLHVSVSSSVLRSELLSMRKKLVRSLNERAGAEVIVDIMIR